MPDRWAPMCLRNYIHETTDQLWADIMIEAPTFANNWVEAHTYVHRKDSEEEVEGEETWEEESKSQMEAEEAAACQGAANPPTHRAAGQQAATQQSAAQQSAAQQSPAQQTAAQQTAAHGSPPRSESRTPDQPPPLTPPPSPPPPSPPSAEAGEGLADRASGEPSEGASVARRAEAEAPATRAARVIDATAEAAPPLASPHEAMAKSHGAAMASDGAELAAGEAVMAVEARAPPRIASPKAATQAAGAASAMASRPPQGPAITSAPAITTSAAVPNGSGEWRLRLWLRQQVAKAVGGAHRARAFLLYHTLPFDNTIWGRLRSLQSVLTIAAAAFPSWRSRTLFYFALLSCLSVELDEYQLTNFILMINGAKFIHSLFLGVFGFVGFYKCSVAQPMPTCSTHGPGTAAHAHACAEGQKRPLHTPAEAIATRCPFLPHLGAAPPITLIVRCAARLSSRQRTLALFRRGRP